MNKTMQKFIKELSKMVVIVLLGALIAGQAAAEETEGRYSPTAIKESFTHKNPAIKYRAGVLVLGNSRDQVHAVFGLPNGYDTLSGGYTEDVYIFMPDGSKYVSPSPRARNVAMGIVTAGTSVAVHQAMLAHERTKLTIYHVYYNPNTQIVRVEKTKGSAFSNPAKP